MPTEDKIRKTGIISEALPNAQFRVDVSGNEVLCSLKGHLKRSNIRLLEGDTVEVLISPMDTTRGFVDKLLN